MKRTPLRRRRRVQSLRKRLWPELSKLIRARDKTCQFAGFFGRRCGGPLGAAHLLPKGKYPLLELYPPNVRAACLMCHIFGWHKSPLEAAEWMKQRLSAEQFLDLMKLRENSLPRKGMTEEQIRAEWRAYGLTS